jgi:WD40 repeat protein
VGSTSKDGTFKLWKIDVRYKMGEDPSCILTVPAPSPDCLFDLISISPDQKFIAVTDTKNNLHFYSIDGKLLETVSKPYDRKATLPRSPFLHFVVLSLLIFLSLCRSHSWNLLVS